MVLSLVVTNVFQFGTNVVIKHEGFENEDEKEKKNKKKEDDDDDGGDTMETMDSKKPSDKPDPMAELGKLASSTLSSSLATATTSKNKEEKPNITDADIDRISKLTDQYAKLIDVQKKLKDGFQTVKLTMNDAKNITNSLKEGLAGFK